MVIQKDTAPATQTTPSKNSAPKKRERERNKLLLNTSYKIQKITKDIDHIVLYAIGPLTFCPL